MALYSLGGAGSDTNVTTLSSILMIYVSGARLLSLHSFAFLNNPYLVQLAFPQP